MLDWIGNQIINFVSTINGSAESINETVVTLNSKEFLDASPFFQYIGAIHYVAGDVIFYVCMSLLFLGIGLTVVKLVIAILRIIRDIKQTALF